MGSAPAVMEVTSGWDGSRENVARHTRAASSGHVTVTESAPRETAIGPARTPVRSRGTDAAAAGSGARVRNITINAEAAEHAEQEVLSAGSANSAFDVVRTPGKVVRMNQDDFTTQHRRQCQSSRDACRIESTDYFGCHRQDRGRTVGPLQRTSVH